MGFLGANVWSRDFWGGGFAGEVLGILLPEGFRFLPPFDYSRYLKPGVTPPPPPPTTTTTTPGKTSQVKNKDVI